MFGAKMMLIFLILSVCLSCAVGLSIHPTTKGFTTVKASKLERKPAQMNSFDVNSNYKADIVAKNYDDEMGFDVRGQENPLLKQASSITVGTLFGLLVWRSLATYSLLDEAIGNSMLNKLLKMCSLVLLVSNGAGIIANYYQPRNYKNLLKALLSINIVREWTEFGYNVAILLVSYLTGSGVSDSDKYVGRFVMNCWWLVLCMSIIRSRWVAANTTPLRAPSTRRRIEREYGWRQ